MSAAIPILKPSQLGDALKDLTFTQGLALGATVLVIFILSDWIANRELSKIPGIEYGSIPIPFIQKWVGAFNFMRDPQRHLTEAYKKYKGSLFRISTIDQEYVVLTDQERLNEVLVAPDHIISAQSATNDILQAKHTVGTFIATEQIHVPLVRTKLTQHIARWVVDIQDEIAKCFDKEIGNPSEWKEVALADVMALTIAKLGNRVIFGEELARDEHHVDNCIKYTVDLISSAHLLRIFPSWIRGLMVLITPIRKRRNLITKSLTPYIQKRLDAFYCGDELPDDMLTWLIETYPEKYRAIGPLVQTMEFINFGSVHTTLSTLMTALYEIAASPEKYVPALRDEFDTILGHSRENVTKQMLGRLIKTDSVLLESARMWPIQIGTVQRDVLQDFTFRDGTVIPAGAKLCLAGGPIQRDDEFFERPDEYDGFRFSRMHEEEGGGESGGDRAHTVSTSFKNSGFGHGRHACPGRFFAINEIKLIMAELLTRYDVKLAPGTAPRSFFFGVSRVTDSKFKILIRARNSHDT